MSTTLEECEVLTFKTQTGRQETVVDAFMLDGNIWLSLAGIAQLYARDEEDITNTLKHIYNAEKLSQADTVKQVSTNKTKTKLFSLEAIVMSGCLTTIWGGTTNSALAMRFRIWATNILKGCPVSNTTVETTLKGENEAAVSLKVETDETYGVVIHADLLGQESLKIEIDAKHPLYQLLSQFYAKFKLNFMGEDTVGISSITGWYFNERAHNRFYNRASNSDTGEGRDYNGVDLLDDKRKIITFVSDDTFYNQESEGAALNTFKLEYAEDKISLIFNKQVEECFFCCSNGTYATKHFECTYFFHLLHELFEGIIRINNAKKEIVKEM